MNLHLAGDGERGIAGACCFRSLAAPADYCRSSARPAAPPLPGYCCCDGSAVLLLLSGPSAVRLLLSGTSVVRLRLGGASAASAASLKRQS